MTYYVKVDLKEGVPINDVFDWIAEKGWIFKQDWRWTSPDYYNLDTHYTFQFDNDKHAAWFMLKWAS